MKFRSLKFLAIILGLTLLCGCSANQYMLGYNGLDPRRVPAGSYQLCSEPILSTGEISRSELLVRAESLGYALLGTSIFVRSRYPLDYATQYGKKLGACLVWVDERYSHTNSGAYSRAVVEGQETITMRDDQGRITGTMTRETVKYEQVPYSDPIYEYVAYYFARHIGESVATVDLLVGQDRRIDKSVQ